MIEVKITDQMKKRAWGKSKRMGKLHNSITRGKGNIAGFIGEEVANEILKGKIDNTYDYDIVGDDGTKYDVKTKRCTSEPKPEYDCSIAEANIKQKCDKYVFVRVENINGKWGRAWILGWVDKTEYFEKAQHLERGQIDRSNGFMVKANCYNLKIHQLNKFEEINYANAEA
jgi:hypothetical protein